MPTGTTKTRQTAFDNLDEIKAIFAARRTDKFIRNTEALPPLISH